MIDTEALSIRIELALARGVLYRLAAHAFRHPGEEWLAEWRFAAEAARGNAPSPAVEHPLGRLLALDVELADLESEHARVLGHVPRACATPYETEWSGAAGELLQYHQIADVAAFYNAFHLELGPGCDERADHASVELEFLRFLCVKEAWAEEHGQVELAELCRDTEKKFLAEHVATWTPGLCARLSSASRGGFYGRVAGFLSTWIEDECRRLGATPGEAFLEPAATSYRPEDACTSCGHASTCAAELRGSQGHADDPIRA
jgi:TorA maturation chaperone TorD